MSDCFCNHPASLNIFRNMWHKVFNNGPSEICGRHPLKNFTLSILEYFVPCLTKNNETFTLKRPDLTLTEGVPLLFWCYEGEMKLSLIWDYFDERCTWLWVYISWCLLFDLRISILFLYLWWKGLDSICISSFTFYLLLPQINRQNMMLSHSKIVMSTCYLHRNGL